MYQYNTVHIPWKLSSGLGFWPMNLMKIKPLPTCIITSSYVFVHDRNTTKIPWRTWQYYVLQRKSMWCHSFKIWGIDTPQDQGSRFNFQGVESSTTYIAQSFSLPRFWLSRMARISCLFSSRYWNIRHIQLLPASAKKKRTSSRSCATLSDREASCVGTCRLITVRTRSSNYCC